MTTTTPSPIPETTAAGQNASGWSASARTLRVGTAPDSWGVWFPDHPGQVPWQRFLDEVVAAGYTWIELGPYGYLPTDAAQLREELGSRGLRLSGGTVFTGFHKTDDQWSRAWSQVEKIAKLTAELGGEHIVVIPDLWRSDATSEVLEPRTLDAEGWSRLAAGHDRLGKALEEEYGLHQQFHSHADSHVGTHSEVERFLELTDEAFTNLCLDTGHFSYYGGDNLKLIEDHPSRIGYLHLKQVDPVKIFDVLKSDTPFAEAVAEGIMVEPDQGVPPLDPIIEAVAALDENTFAIVEQDMFGCSVDAPYPIAERTLATILGSTASATTDR